MIKKINKIRNLGLVFKDYTRPAALSYFKKANLIYGWNGCGKTTLTRLYDGVGGNPLAGLEFDVEDESGNKYSQTDTYPEKIRIFNQDYIEKNVRVLDSRASSISILLGEENSELIKKIEGYRKELQGDPENPEIPGKVALLKTSNTKAQQSRDQYSSKFTEIAKTIGIAIGGNALRTYKRQQAHADFEMLSKKSELSQDELNQYLLAAKQESLQVIKSLGIRKLIINEEEKNAVTTLNEIADEARKLLNETVEASIIKRLSNIPDISSWVEEGIALHAKHKSSKCEYCQQVIPAPRISELAKHFNDADRRLKESLDKLAKQLNTIRTIIDEVGLPDKARFYPNLQKEFAATTKGFQTAKADLVADIDDLTKEINEKKLTHVHLRQDSPALAGLFV